jgi:hypothetical protein
MVGKEIYDKIKLIMNDYIESRIDIYQAAVKIVDTLFRWETSYMPLHAYNEDPWRLRNYDVLLIEDIIETCGEIAVNQESFVMCVSEEIDERFFKR